MLDLLTEAEVRVLGSLVEKQLTTPDYYPLTLNSLTAACNQKSNRDPVMSLSETEIQAAVDRLRDIDLIYLFYGSGSRTVKYKHMLPGVYELDPAETAVITVLMLRGAQTLGEIRERSSRLHAWGGPDEVQTALDGLARREEPLITRLERKAGQKEARYAHLLSGEPPDVPSMEAAERTPERSGTKIEMLEQEIESLKAELAELKQRFDEFSSQF